MVDRLPVVEHRADGIWCEQHGGQGVLSADARVRPHGGGVAGMIVDKANERGREGGAGEGEVS